jgi:membrane-bound lytic murein transglycosylase F
LRAAIVITLALLLGTCSERPPLLEQVHILGQLTVVSRNSPTTYYLGPFGDTGLEYDLARRFADYLGVKLKIYAPDDFSQVLSDVRHGEADLAAAGLSITPDRKQDLRFGPTYQDVTQEVVYRYGEDRPHGPEDLVGHSLAVVAGSSHDEQLQKLRKDHPDLNWDAESNVESDELLARVARGELDYTVADSTEVALNRRYYPELRVAFNLRDPEPIAWAFRRDGDKSLYRAAQAFFHKIENDGTLDQLIERYYGHTDRFDYVGTRIFMQHVASRLPAYRSAFETAGDESGIDWRLLAAIGYQESHWNPRAISPTGVRGIMMLTQVTASQVGIDNRIDPQQSIVGGAQYFASVKAMIPDRIPEPDRTWMALAAYNIGFFHLEDARILTEMRGGDPDRWIDVRDNLPLLAQRKWYKKTKYGYARGEEPVIYVENIRSYYDILLWATGSKQSPNTVPDESTEGVTTAQNSAAVNQTP